MARSTGMKNQQKGHQRRAHMSLSPVWSSAGKGCVGAWSHPAA